METFQAALSQEGDLHVAQCLEIDIASQGSTPAEAIANLREAIELFFEVASPEEIESRVRRPVNVHQLEAEVG